MDLRAQTLEVEEEVRRGLERLLLRSSFILGPEVAEFEAAFAAASGVEHCVGVASGTDALELALRACGIGPGDEVLVPTNSFVASAVAVVRAGATVRFADCDPATFLLTKAEAAARLTKRTRALLPVHLYGQLAPMNELHELAESHDLVVLEDAAQCQGASQDGRAAGAIGRAAATSFYPAKNLGAFGDAGAVVTRDAEIAGRLRRLRNYGSEEKYVHPEVGFNSRLDSLQAIVLTAKLERLATWNEARRRAAARYDELLSGIAGVERPRTRAGNVHVFHLYVVRVSERDRVRRALAESGVDTGIHYPIPIHLQPAFASLGHRAGDFPHAERAADEILSLPMFPGITPAQQERVAAALAKAVAM